MATEDIETRLYNDKYLVKFKAGTHRYFINSRPQIGVTSVISKIINKPQLMTWPLNMALSSLEEQIDHVLTRRALDKAKKAYLVRRDAGSDTGSLVHNLVEQRLAGHEFSGQELTAMPIEAANALGAFETFIAQSRPEILAVEKVVYSESLKFAGTFDSILKIGPKVYLTDLKTTNAGRQSPYGIYPENFIQLGAYAYAYEEQRIYEDNNGGSKLPPLDDLMIVSCKKDGKLDTKTASEVGLTILECAKLWECTLTLYDTFNTLNRKLGGA